MSLSRIDLLPVELIHNIFIYLSAHEIFNAFSNLTDYLDAILISYDRYLLNFRSILKSHFNVTCHSIRPDQVISLTLSDDDETPGQSELFFSLFDIEQFIHLRSFDISSMNNDTCKKLSNLHKLKYLSSLELPRLFQPYCMNFDSAIRKVLPQLNRLMVHNTYYLLDNSLPNLHHLILKHCNCSQLLTILKLIPNLLSLDIILIPDTRTNWWPNNVPVLTNLRKLVLTSYGEKLTMIQIRGFLSKMPNLTHFELDTQGSMDLIDGQQWEIILSNVILFNFRIHLLDSLWNFPEENILQSFRSLFWLEHKCWFVAYDGSHMRNIFTIPRFLSNIVTYPFIDWPPLCTSPDFCFDKYIKCLHVSLFNPVPHRFTNTTLLVFDTNKIITDIGLSTFISFVEHMDFLHSISFRDLSVLDYVPNNVVFKKIRSLYVRDINARANVRIQLDINRLCIVFPQLERLNMELTSRDDLLLLIDQLKYLSIAKFELNHSLSVTRDWLIKNSRRLKANNDFTFQFINNKIHLWMNHEESSSNEQVSKWYWPLSCTLQ